MRANYHKQTLTCDVYCMLNVNTKNCDKAIIVTTMFLVDIVCFLAFLPSRVSLALSSCFHGCEWRQWKRILHLPAYFLSFCEKKTFRGTCWVELDRCIAIPIHQPKWWHCRCLVSAMFARNRYAIVLRGVFGNQVLLLRLWSFNANSVPFLKERSPRLHLAVRNIQAAAQSHQ